MIRYEEMTYQNIKENLEKRILVIPAGSIEQHSLHLPLAVDSILATGLAERLVNLIDGIMAPALTYGAISLSNSGGGMNFPGTIGIWAETLIPWYRQIIKGYVKAGARRILLLNAHWENEFSIIQAIESAKEEFGENVQIVEFSWWSLIDKEDMERIFGQSFSWSEEHAGQAETALMIELAPALVGKFDPDVKPLCGNPDIYTTKENEQIRKNHGSLAPYAHVTKSMSKQFIELLMERLQKTVEELMADEEAK